MHTGDFIAMYSKDRIISDRSDKVSALMDLLENVDGMDDMEILTVFCGKDVSGDEISRAQEMISGRWPDLEVDMLAGGQEIYCFIVGLE